VPLGAGDSPDKLIGHVNNATLTLQCALDPIEPFVLNEGEVCDAPPNIPLAAGESTGIGVAITGAVTVLGPEGEAFTELSNITFEFREVTRRDQTIDFFLTSFDADADDTRLGSLAILAPHIHLAAPVGAPLIGDTVSFPAGTLRMEVSGVAMSEGEVLFDGLRSSSVYVNTDVATVVWTIDGGFAFVDAPFEVDRHIFVLSTEKGVAEVR
jgi:hypothetical protein